MNTDRTIKLIHKKMDDCSKYIIRQIGKIVKEDGVLPIKFDTVFVNENETPSVCEYEKYDYLMWDDTENDVRIIDDEQNAHSLNVLTITELLELFYKIV